MALFASRLLPCDVHIPLFGMATVEEKMGELKRSTFDAVHDGMTRARAANSAGKYKACEKALADVRRLMPAGLQTASSRQKH